MRPWSWASVNNNRSYRLWVAPHCYKDLISRSGACREERTGAGFFFSELALPECTLFDGRRKGLVTNEHKVVSLVYALELHRFGYPTTNIYSVNLSFVHNHLTYPGSSFSGQILKS